jgi:hypothetical protein
MWFFPVRHAENGPQLIVQIASGDCAISEVVPERQR